MITPLTQGLIAGVVALAGIGAVATANADGGTFTCGVETTTQSGMTTYQGRVMSPTVLTGDYNFSLRSTGGGGSSNINQGGPFAAMANTEVSVGQVMVNAGSKVQVSFTVTTGGKSYDCSQSTGRI